MLTADQLEEKMKGISRSYFLVDVRKDRESYYALTPEELQSHWLCNSGLTLNLIMDGELKKAWDVIKKFDPRNPMRIGLTIVHPEVSWKEFFQVISFLKEMKLPINSVMLTAARPQILNGFGDFTRTFPFLIRKKEFFIETISWLYDGDSVHFIYNLCLAEYYYQINNLLDAEVLVSRTIKEFDRNSERRLLFAALYLQSKILIAHGSPVHSKSYIDNIRAFVKEEGRAEFSYNIDAAECLTALYEGDYQAIALWVKNDSPDEFGDFNMLDLYRYMIKIRCYIVNGNCPAVIALAEKLRPLLEAGKRFMDLCELDSLLAMALFQADKKDLAFTCLERALKVARRRSYYRLMADEGQVMFHLLSAYIKEKRLTPFLQKLLDMTRPMAIAYPLYLQVQYKNDQFFSQTEIEILKLLEQGKSKEEIGEYFFISVNTVKYHMKKIYSKLQVSSPHHAVWNARLLGLI